MELEITSTQNPRIKQVMRLRKRRERDQSGTFLIEGYRELKRALENGRRVETLYYSREHFLGVNENGLLAMCREQNAELVSCTAPVFAKISYRDRPDGLLAVAPQQHLGLDDLDLPENPFLLIAESIEKPGNLGTLLRSSDAAGVTALIVTDACTDIHNPNVVRASVGALFTVPVIEAESRGTYAWLKAHGIATVAATPAAALNYTDADLSGPVAIVVGSEQYGLTPASITEADIQISLPMRGQCDSLNVAASATILLYEVLRQRTLSGR